MIYCIPSDGNFPFSLRLLLTLLVHVLAHAWSVSSIISCLQSLLDEKCGKDFYMDNRVNQACYNVMVETVICIIAGFCPPSKGRMPISTNLFNFERRSSINVLLAVISSPQSNWHYRRHFSSWFQFSVNLSSLLQAKQVHGWFDVLPDTVEINCAV